MNVFFKTKLFKLRLDRKLMKILCLSCFKAMTKCYFLSRSGNADTDQRLKYKIPIWPEAISLEPEILLSSSMGWEMAKEEYQAQCLESDCLKVKPALTF